MCEPLALRMNRGVPPTDLNARTGLFTPPGISSCARSNNAFDRATGNGMIALVGGSSADPETQKGSYSALARFEERILTALYRQAIVGQQN